MLRIVSFVVALSMVSTPALARVLIMKCGPGEALFKYESSFFGLSDAKIFEFKNGLWRPYCDSIAEFARERGLSKTGYTSVDLFVDGKSANCQARHREYQNKPFGITLNFEVLRRTTYFTNGGSTTYRCTKVTPQ